MIQISNLLTEQTVFANLTVKTKQEALNILITSLDISTTKIETVKQAVLERENIYSTGIGGGLAIPHSKIDCLNKNYAAFASLNEPIAYNAVDSEPVSIIFLLAGPQHDDRQHVKLLSRISRLMSNNNFREQLKDLGSSEAIITAFYNEEQSYYRS